VVSERRPFRIVDRGRAALVAGTPVHWNVSETAVRDLAADDGIREGVSVLLARAPEALWWRRAGGRLRLVERALRADADCHVVGMARVTHVAEAAVEWARTGTDDAFPIAEVGPRPVVTLGSGDHLEWLLVGDAPPRPDQLDVPLARAAGIVLGPLLSLSGMLYLARAAEQLRSAGRL
jgi:hypothetical protein